MPQKEKHYFRSQIYEVDYGRGVIKMKNKLCPRCGRVMANHKNRWSCGYCHYTTFSSTSSS